MIQLKNMKERVTKKELDRIRHVDVCDANTGPIFLTYRTKEEVKRFIASWKEEHAPIYTFTAEDGVRHVAVENCR